MNIKDMTIEQIEAHLAERKRVKPRATPEIILDLWFKAGGSRLLREILEDLDWTPPKQDYELELVEGTPCLMKSLGYWITQIYEPSYHKDQVCIPFDRSLVGKAVDNEKTKTMDFGGI